VSQPAPQAGRVAAGARGYFTAAAFAAVGW
jgi:hypothetical protein